jgi:hypothetical protein
MSSRFVVVDRDTPMLLSPSLQDWLPDGHLAHFVVETVALLPLHGFQVNTRGTGSAQMPPSMMLSLLIQSRRRPRRKRPLNTILRIPKAGS